MPKDLPEKQTSGFGKISPKLRTMRIRTRFTLRLSLIPCGKCRVHPVRQLASVYSAEAICELQYSDI